MASQPHPSGLSTRVAPPGLTLPVPIHVSLTSAALGLCTLALGVIYLTAPPKRTGPLSSSTMGLLEVPLGVVMMCLGLLVVAATVAGKARSSAHGVAAMTHFVYTVALVLTFLQTVPPKPTVASVLSVFAFVAHGGACIDYWKRGWR